MKKAKKIEPAKIEESFIKINFTHEGKSISSSKLLCERVSVIEIAVAISLLNQLFNKKNVQGLE